jgi:rsbT co-antagonist protein RsbR
MSAKLLAAIRAQRARAVVIDVTGVPTLDTAAAEHLMRCARSSRLMGARLIVSGPSSDACRTLTTIGVSMTGVDTVGSLAEALQMAGAISRT